MKRICAVFLVLLSLAVSIRAEKHASFPLDTIEHARQSLTALPSPCIHKKKDYWSYVVCLGKEVRQYHAVQGPSSEMLSYHQAEKDADWSLGKFKNERIGKVKRAGVVSFSLIQSYEGGQHCDENRKHRKTDVVFVCKESVNGAEITSIREPSLCEYMIMIETNLLCKGAPAVHHEGAAQSETEHITRKKAALGSTDGSQTSSEKIPSPPHRQPKKHTSGQTSTSKQPDSVGPDDTVESPYVQKIRKDISFHDRSQSFATLLPSGSSFESALSTLSDTSLLEMGLEIKEELVRVKNALQKYERTFGDYHGPCYVHPWRLMDYGYEPVVVGCHNRDLSGRPTHPWCPTAQSMATVQEEHGVAPFSFGREKVVGCDCDGQERQLCWSFDDE